MQCLTVDSVVSVSLTALNCSPCHGPAVKCIILLALLIPGSRDVNKKSEMRSKAGQRRQVLFLLKVDLAIHSMG